MSLTKYLAGNALSQSPRSSLKGWYVGHFFNSPDDIRMTSDVEVKWESHAAKDRRHSWAMCERASTLTVLVRGAFRISFVDEDILLVQEGDYALWKPQVPYFWEAEKDSMLLTIRWPSGDGDFRDVPNPRSAAKVLDFPT